MGSRRHPRALIAAAIAAPVIWIARPDPLWLARTSLIYAAALVMVYFYLSYLLEERRLVALPESLVPFEERHLD